MSLREKTIYLLKCILAVSIFGIGIAYLKPEHAWENGHSTLYNSVSFYGRYRWHGTKSLLMIFERFGYAESRNFTIVMCCFFIVVLSVGSFIFFRKSHNFTETGTIFNYYMFNGVICCFLDEGVFGFLGLLCGISMCCLFRLHKSLKYEMLSWGMGYFGMMVFRIALGWYITAGFLG